MSDFPWDPTSGNADYTSSPYQYWAGSEPKEAGGKVEFVINNMLYTTNIEADGSWTFQLPVMLMDGQHNLSVRYIDRAMNYGPPYLSTIHVDTTPPAKPIIQAVQDDVGDSMPLFNGQITDDTKPRFSGSAEPQSIVRLFDKNTGALLGSAVANANGYWTIEEELGYGQREVFVTSSDRHNQASEPSESWVVNIKDPNVPPASDPYITGGADNVGAAQGELAFGAVTDDNRPTLKGMAEPGSIVWLFVKNAADQWLILGSTRAESNGSWSMETAQLNAGQYDFQVGSSDVRNPAADIFRLTIADAGSDALKPVIVDAFDDVGAATGALANGALTNDSTPTLRGTAEANSIVYIRYGRSTIGFEPVASVKANAKGEWSFTPELYQDHVWDFYVSSSTTFDYTRRFQIELDTMAGSPVIEGAWDNSGEGKLVAHNGYTKDRTPELRGTAEPNSTVTLQYVDRSRPWSQGTTVTVQAGPDGKWSHQLPALDNTYYHFRTKITDAAGNDSSYSANFLLYIDSIAPESPVITGVWDNEGSLRELANGDFTNDRTPEIRGTGEPNSKIIVVLAKGQEGWSNNNRTVETWADNNGNWKVTVPAPALTDDRWYFRAKAVDKAGNESALGAQAVIEVRGNLIDSRTVWDFNDGTLQGWTAAGKYAQSGQLLVGKWSAPANSNEAGSSTGGGDGFAGNVVYRDITVIKGQVYQFSFDVVRLNDSYTAPRLGMTVDGQTIISQSDVGQSWQNRSGTYIANETKTVRVAVTNGQDSGSGNDFAFDNIVIQPGLTKAVTWNFNDGTLGGWKAVGEYAESGMLQVKRWSANATSNQVGTTTPGKADMSGEVIYHEIRVEKGQSYDFNFHAYRLLGLYETPKLGLTVDGQTVIPHTSLTSMTGVNYSGRYVATETKIVRVAVSNGEKSTYGNDFAIDNITVKPVAGGRSGKSLQLDDTLLQIDEEQATLLLADALEGTVQKGVDLNGHGSTTLTVTAGDVLAFGEKDLFIADGRTQLMINGDASDVVNLDELLGDSQDWSQLTGTMTVGGVEYNVWQHSGEDAELLIQSGVQTQLN